MQNDFDYAYIIDTKSDVRANPKIAGTTHNVFGIQTGVAIMFLLKKAEKDNPTCSINYVTMDDFWPKAQKLEWFSEHKLSTIPFEHLRPDKRNNWINLSDNNWDELLSVADKAVKLNKSRKALFTNFSLGIATNRDEWVYDFEKNSVKSKAKFFCDFFNSEKERWEASNQKKPTNEFVNRTIKWTSELESHLRKGNNLIV